MNQSGVVFSIILSYDITVQIVRKAKPNWLQSKLNVTSSLCRFEAYLCNSSNKNNIEKSVMCRKTQRSGLPLKSVLFGAIIQHVYCVCW